MSSIRLRPPVAALAAALLAVAACGRTLTAEKPASDGGSTAEVVAEVDGVPITRADLDQRAGARLARFRQEEYEVRRQVLNEMIEERLLQKEAGVRGLSTEQLLRDEVDRQVGPANPQEVEAVYEANRARLGGQPREQVLPQIEAQLRQRALALRREEFRRQLAARAKVRVSLQAPRSEVVVPAGAPTLGPAGARVTIVEFADYQCPYCHRAQVTIDQVMSRYAGQVQLVHRDFPLDFHAQAFAAARAARCAGEQGRFWDYHRSLMTVPGDLSEADLLARAAGFQLDAAGFRTCLSSSRHDPAIRESVDAGARMGVTGTPTYFVNGRMLTGARPLEEFEEIIEAELARTS